MVDRPIRRNKARLARHAVAKHKITSFADLGGCWGVHSSYTLDLLARHTIERAVVADQRITDLSTERGAPYPQLEFVRGLLGEQKVIGAVGAVDALIMYDILLHQVAPDWDDFLAEWSKHARVLIIYNQMWKQEGPTVRFVDKGKDWYKANVHFPDEAGIDEWFARHETFSNEQGKPFRDTHNYWQWGITTEDLIACIKSLGFRLDYFENYGPFRPSKHPWIQDEGFIFVR